MKLLELFESVKTEVIWPFTNMGMAEDEKHGGEAAKIVQNLTWPIAIATVSAYTLLSHVHSLFQAGN